jgi:hypothetical protein
MASHCCIRSNATESSPGKKDGKTYIQDEPDQYLVDELKTYFNLGQPDNVYLNMDKAFKVRGHPADAKSKPADLAHRRAENTDLYCLIASTRIGFMKASYAVVRAAIRSIRLTLPSDNATTGRREISSSGLRSDHSPKSCSQSHASDPALVSGNKNGCGVK